MLKIHRAELTQAELTQGRVDSGANLTSGRVDPLPIYWGGYRAETTHQNRPMIWPKQLCGNDSNQGTMWKEEDTNWHQVRHEN